MRRSPFWGGFLGSLLGPTLSRLVIRWGRYVLIGLGVLAALAYRWWVEQDRWTHVFIVTMVLTLLALWVRHRLGRPVVPRPRRAPAPGGPKQVLYRWWEPTDLPYGLKCSCGKPRHPGELVYIGITGAHRSREMDDDRQEACWWNQEPPVEGTQQLYSTRAAVERAEVNAIETERPRENKMHNKVWS